VERIEVLRGPQGTLYGRNAMGGVINIITKQPSNTMEGLVEMNFGNYAQQRYLAALRMPLVKDKLYFGASFLYDGRNGYYNNKYNNQTYDQQHSFQGNYYLKYIANSHWSFNLNLKHRDNRNNGAFPLVMGVANAFKNPYTLNQNAITTMVDNSSNAALIMNYTGRNFNFNSQTAYQKNYRIYTNPIDGDFSPLDAISIINNYGKDWNSVKVITQDFKFTSPASSVSKWKWTTGAFLFYQDAPTKQATRYGKDANLLGIGDSLFSTINSTKAYKRGFAFYGQAGYALTDKLNITFGMRYDYEHQEQSVLGEYQHDPSPNTIIIRPDTTGNISFSAFSPKVSLDYHLNERSMLYSIYSRGFRTGGLSPLSSDPSQPPLVGFKPEYSNSFELGLKNTLFKNVFIFNIALFYTNINNVQVPTLILPDAITVTKNAGKLSSHGIEMEISAKPAKGLLLQYSFGYTDSRFDLLKLSQQGIETDLAGKHQIFTPDITAFLAAQYSYPFCNGHLKAIIRGEWRYLGTTYFDLANTLQQSPYSIFNLRTGITYRKTELMLWARNLTDTKYISYAYDFGAVHLGDPSTIGITISSRF
jgi:iron complex outermembrane receptor protein